MDSKIRPESLADRCRACVADVIIDPIENALKLDFDSNLNRLIEITGSYLSRLETLLPPGLPQQLIQEVSLKSPIAGVLVQGLQSRHLTEIFIDYHISIPQSLVKACFSLLESTIESISLPSVTIYDDSFEALSNSSAASSLKHIKALKLALSDSSISALSRFPNLNRLSGSLMRASREIYERLRGRKESSEEESDIIVGFDDLDSSHDVSVISIRFENQFRSFPWLNSLSNVVELNFRDVGAFYEQRVWPPQLQTLRITQAAKYRQPEDSDQLASAFCTSLIAQCPLLTTLVIFTKSILFRRAHAKQLLDGFPSLKHLDIRNLLPLSTDSETPMDEDDFGLDTEVPHFNEEPLEVVHTGLEWLPHVGGVTLVMKWLPAVRNLFLEDALKLSAQILPNLNSISGYYNRFIPEQVEAVETRLPKYRYLRQFQFTLHDTQLPAVCGLRTLHSLKLFSVQLSQQSIELCLSSLALLLDVVLVWDQKDGTEKSNVSWIKHAALLNLDLAMGQPTSELIMAPDLPALESCQLRGAFAENVKVTIAELPSLRSLHLAKQGAISEVSLEVSDCPLLYKASINGITLTLRTVVRCPSFNLLKLKYQASIKEDLPDLVRISPNHYLVRKSETLL